MHKAFAPQQFKKAPQYCHSVYGVGQQKPKSTGIRDLCQPDFKPSPSTYDKPTAQFLNTGAISENPDLQGLQDVPDLKFNDYVVYDESQVKMRYIVDMDVVLK